ncbi:MAG: hypothetical protein IPP96_16240 [Chitinophagaceae bacterium]|nr:hypothetical protein [Chitinophagaceae bacterium]
MAEVIMYDFVKFKKFLDENVFSKAVRDKLIKAGTTFSNEEYSLTKLGPGKMRSGSPSISLTKSADGKHSLTKAGETPIDVDSKVPPKLE